MKNLFTVLLVSVTPFFLKAQNTNFLHGSESVYFLGRTEIKSGCLMNDMHLDAGSIDRNLAKKFILGLDTANAEKLTGMMEGDSGNTNFTPANNLWKSKADKYWLTYFYEENNIYNSPVKFSFTKPFYSTKPNLIEIKTSGLYLTLNPVLGLETGSKKDYISPLTVNTRGYELKGSISKKVGFYSYFTENQIWFPDYIKGYEKEFHVLPGQGYWKRYASTGYDFFDSRAYITFSATKNIQMKFGNDRNFIGNGYRSLLLSDFAQDYLYLRINTQVWRFSYHNIFAEMTDYKKNTANIYPKKYAAFHYLSIDLFKFLNIGLFEGIMFYDKKTLRQGFELNYLNPVIFYRSAEQNLGSGDNAIMGFNWNAILLKSIRLYGQLVLDEFKITEIANNKGWWGNKYGLQFGFKYIDIFTLPNVDLQTELNMVQPYTYSHDTTANNYGHFNQPLAHPLGANFTEMVNILRINTYAPLIITIKHFYYQQGKDTGSLNYGSNIFMSYNTRVKEYGNKILQGEKTTVQLLEATASYQLRHNLFFDVKAVYRTEKNASVSLTNSYYGAGIRLNFVPKNYNF